MGCAPVGCPELHRVQLVQNQPGTNPPWVGEGDGDRGGMCKGLGLAHKSFTGGLSSTPRPHRAVFVFPTLRLQRGGEILLAVPAGDGAGVMDGSGAGRVWGRYGEQTPEIRQGPAGRWAAERPAPLPAAGSVCTGARLGSLGCPGSLTLCPGAGGRKGETEANRLGAGLCWGPLASRPDAPKSPLYKV